VGEMVEVITVADHKRALAVIKLLKQKGVHDVGFWPRDMLGSDIGILGGGPLPLELPFRFQAREPAGPFVIAVDRDLVPYARDYLDSPEGQREIERLMAEE